MKLYTHHLTTRYFLWTPSGGNACMMYYPDPIANGAYPNNIANTSGGNVDFVGFSLYSYPAWELAYYGFVRTFQQIYAQNFGNVYTAQKPIIIAEGGCATGSYQAAWTANALTQLQVYANNSSPYSSSDLVAMCWFNAPTQDVWGFNLPSPDFSVSPSIWHL